VNILADALVCHVVVWVPAGGWITEVKGRGRIAQKASGSAYTRLLCSLNASTIMCPPAAAAASQDVRKFRRCSKH